jgi:hypothetical protein
VSDGGYTPGVSDPTSPTSEVPAPTVDVPGAGGDPTSRIDVPHRGPSRSQLPLVFIAVAAACFLVGIAVATTTRPAVLDTVLAEGDVGPDGGTIRFATGQLVFPAKAVDGELHVTVRRSTIDDRLRIRHDGRDIAIEPGELRAFRFEPAGVAFAEPVEITFRLPEDARNGSVFVIGSDGARPLEGTIDPARGTATVRVRDFSFEGS